MTVRTVISGAPGLSTSLEMSGKLEGAAAALNAFEGVALDPEAEAEIAAALEACAARARAAYAAQDESPLAAADANEDDPDLPFFRAADAMDYRGALEPPVALEEFVPFADGEDSWRDAGAEKPAALVALEEEMARKALERDAPGSSRRRKGGPRKSRLRPTP